MKRILLLSFVLITSILFDVMAQRTVSGKITDDTGEPLPGVNVVIKGTTTGTQTDLDGDYRLSVDDGAILVFSYVGFETQEVEVGSRTAIDISMGGAVQLSEVVVTAAGLQVESRKIGYGISSVSGEDLTVARESNITNALIGKTTGVVVNQTGGNLGSSSQVIIRGITSLAGNNNPLWVVDGIPINNAQDVTGSRIAGNRDTFNGAAVINPDDVESMNILKGAAATALYGSRAAAGAIIVTTKKGKRSGSGNPQISINSTVRFEELFRTPDMQYQYAGGAFGKYDSSAIGNAFGPRIAGQTVRDFNGNPITLRAYENNYEDFYETGTTFINNIAVSDANDRSDYRFSVTSLNQDGILPASELDRLTLGLNAGAQHTKWLKTRFSVQYITTDIEGTGAAGANDQNIIPWTQFTPSTNFNWFKSRIDESGNQINTPAPDANNPFWLREENINRRNDDRFIGSITQIISPVDNLNITSRIGYDYNNDKRLITNRVGTITALTGTYDVDNLVREQFNWDLIADYTADISSDISLTGILGYNYNQRILRRERLQASDLAVPELFNPGASQTTTPTRGFSETRLQGVFGQIQIGYRDYLTLELSARNDWSSALPLDNNSYFYPAVTTAFIFTDALDIGSDFFTFGKLRASWAQVGNTTNPYALDFRFFPETEANGQYGLDLNFPFLGQLGFNKTARIPNANLLPEEQTTIEMGAELRFFNDRLGLDVTWYQTENSNQILNRPIPESTGFAEQTVNGGTLENTGIEITLDGNIINSDALRWNSIINFSTLDIKVSDLGANRFLLPNASAFSSVQVVAENNGSVEITGIPYLRDSVTGRPIIDPTTGRRRADQVRSLGNVFPDMTWGWTNQFSYKGFTLSVTVDGQIGGKIKSATVENLWDAGFTVETAENRSGTYIDRSGIIIETDADGNVTRRDNDVPVRSTADFWETLDGGVSITEHSVFDADFIKLREIGFSYSLPQSILNSTPFNSIQVGVEGRNLALLYSKVPHIDPEANLFGAGGGPGGVERSAVPSTRSLGFNLRLVF